MKNLTRDQLLICIHELGDSYQKKLGELLQLCGQDPGIKRIELEITPSVAADRFPVTAWALKADRSDCNSEVSDAVLDVFTSLDPLLSPEYKDSPCIDITSKEDNLPNVDLFDLNLGQWSKFKSR